MNLEQLIREYEPPQRAAEVIKNAKIALLVGVVGAGKDTIKRQLLIKPGYREIVSHTTRSSRLNNGVPEVDGQDYHFIDPAQAAQMLQDKEFIEAKLVHGTVYGTSLRELERASEEGAIALTDLDVQGVAEYKEVSPAVVALFVIPPSYDLWQSRLRRRYSSEDEFRAEWPKRRISAINELECALSVPYFHFVLNDDIERAARVSDEIIRRGDTYLREDDEVRLLARKLYDEIIARG